MDVCVAKHSLCYIKWRTILLCLVSKGTKITRLVVYKCSTALNLATEVASMDLEQPRRKQFMFSLFLYRSLVVKTSELTSLHPEVTCSQNKNKFFTGGKSKQTKQIVSKKGRNSFYHSILLYGRKALAFEQEYFHHVERLTAYFQKILSKAVRRVQSRALLYIQEISRHRKN